MNLYIDIETLPTDRGDVAGDIRLSLLADLTKSIAEVHAPSNYKPETAELWMANQGQQKIQDLEDAYDKAVDQAIRATGLDGSLGRICVIGWAIDDGEVDSLASDWDERTLLLDFKTLMERSDVAGEVYPPRVVGHNVKMFDLRFLLHRYIVHRIEPPLVIEHAAHSKPWAEQDVYDTMTQWSGMGGKFIKLDKLCKALGVPSPKDGIDGSMVWDAVKEGRILDVQKYCEKDVAATREVFKLMTFGKLK